MISLWFLSFHINRLPALKSQRHTFWFLERKILCFSPLPLVSLLPFHIALTFPLFLVDLKSRWEAIHFFISREVNIIHWSLWIFRFSLTTLIFLRVDSLSCELEFPKNHRRGKCLTSSDFKMFYVIQRNKLKAPRRKIFFIKIWLQSKW